MSPLSRDVTITNKLGLHARASAKLVRVASRFESDVTLSKDGMSVNGKSILGMLTLAATRGSIVLVTCQGSDQEAAMAAVVDCIESRFGEGE